jgi:hypothetical protein
MGFASIRSAAALALLGLLAAPAGAGPFGGAGPTMLCAPTFGGCGVATTQHMLDREEDNSQLLYNYGQMSLSAQQGSRQVQYVMRVSADPAADEIPHLAKSWQRQFPGQSVPQIAEFMRQLENGYAQTVKGEGLAPESLPVSCDYTAESLYEVGTGRHVSGGTARLNIRATCVYMIAILEQGGYLQDNAQRQKVLQFMTVAAGVLRARDAASVSSHNEALRQKNAADARGVFKSFFNIDAAAVPPEQFPCMFAGKGASCSDIMHQAPGIFPKIVAKYP